MAPVVSEALHEQDPGLVVPSLVPTNTFEVSLHIHEALFKPPPADSVDCGEPIDTHSMRTLKKLIEEVKSDSMTAGI